MTEDALLSDLCAICHLNRPRYKCPRCTIQTCSLPCVKRHKLWSQCSGARNPAAYRKRHELATLSSIDQDYNFITSVERTIQRADDQSQQHSIVLNGSRRKRVKGEARRDAEIQQTGAIVLKAPSGMSRSLQNKSKWDNRHKCLLWTVEWILENGEKVFGNCQEVRTVQEAFTNAVGTRRTRSAQGCVSKTPTIASSLDIEFGSEIQKLAESASSAHTESTSEPTHYFYLHRPNLPSNIKCVIPLKPDITVKDTVRGTVLNEFPTIFVLSVCREELQKPFITEEGYLTQNGTGALQAIPSSLTQTFTEDDHDKEMKSLESRPIIDEKPITEVLQRDLVT